MIEMHGWLASLGAVRCGLRIGCQIQLLAGFRHMVHHSLRTQNPVPCSTLLPGRATRTRVYSVLAMETWLAVEAAHLLIAIR